MSELEPEREAARSPEERQLRQAPSIFHSFNYAFEGIIWVLRTQRNMRLHFAAGVLVLIGGLVIGVTRNDLLLLLVAISFVLITEMINTAIEAAVDIATTAFDPLAKIAKDVAAGAVLIAATNALAIGYLVYADRLTDPSYHALRRVRESPLNLAVITLTLVVALVISLKALSRSGTPLRGGMPSGHAAVAFAGWAAVTLLTARYEHHLLISTLAFLMAALVVQTRVEAGVHSVFESLLGALVGAVVALTVFQFWS